MDKPTSAEVLKDALQKVENKLRVATLNMNDLKSGKHEDSDLLLAIIEHPESLKEMKIHDVGYAFGLASSLGKIQAMKILKERGINNAEMSTGLAYAAQNNMIEAMKLIKDWGIQDFNLALIYASARGEIKAANLLIEWGAFDFNSSFMVAAFHGQIGIMKLIKEMKNVYSVVPINELNGQSKDQDDFKQQIKTVQNMMTFDLTGAMVKSVLGNQIEVIKLLKEWGVDNFSWPFAMAVASNKTEIMELLKGWGVDRLERFPYLAAQSGHLEALKLLREWDSDLSDCFVVAVENGQIETLKLLKSWGICDLEAGMKMVKLGKQKKVLELLQKWKAEDDK